MGRSELDPVAILRTLGVDDPTAIAPVAGGWDTALWQVRRGGEAFALRVFRPDQVETWRREAVAMAAARAGGIPVPAIHARGVWRGRPALLLSWCAGTHLIAAIQRRPWRVWRLGAAFGRAQSRIHRLPTPPELHSGGESWLDWVGPEAVELKARLRAVDPLPDRLLHLDYHPLNVMSDGRRVTAVLDWANARAGDPRADWARTLGILRLAPPPPEVPLPLVLSLRRVLEAAWRHGYGPVPGDPEAMPLFHAWVGTVMLRDLAPRLGREGIWLKPEDLERIRRWTEHWQRKAGIDR